MVTDDTIELPIVPPSEDEVVAALLADIDDRVDQLRKFLPHRDDAGARMVLRGELESMVSDAQQIEGVLAERETDDPDDLDHLSERYSEVMAAAHDEHGAAADEVHAVIASHQGGA